MTQTAYSVPYVSFAQQNAQIKQELMEAFSTVLDSGQYIMGPELTAFEREFAAYCQAEFASGIASGTCALHLVMRSLGLKEGDEIITAPNSFLASASTIALAGAKPVFVDVREDMNMDPDKLEVAITPRTRAIVPVHLTGRPARMVEILEIARAHNLFVLEDSAQAVGAKLKGKRVGSWGDAGCFSLHPLKNLRAIGDGGMMTTNNPELRDQIIKARNHGLINRDTCEFWSFNCRLDEVQAAILRVQLRYLDEWTEERRRLAFRYNDLLRPYVNVPDEGPEEYLVYQTYMIQADRRDELRQFLNDNGVQCLVHYAKPIHLQPAAEGLGYTADDFPVTMKVVSRILSLPLFPGMTQEQQDRVVELIAKFYQTH
ncbi:MAG: DegT/DnrJ/EryC1/StrS family aminotransferase [Leptolyngbyaceae cyanobacterium bins.59]|nr:DegT/DnrJ/EryC1/StrS family aminotransferase [Leptolyngbyaceae cyanobacterium bins.59]